MSRYRHLRWAVAAFSAAIAIPAQANIGLPLIAVILPPLWLALLPIVLIEAAVVAKMSHLSFRLTLAATALANVMSSVIGVPLLWFILATVELVCCGSARGLDDFWSKLYAVTIQAPWLIPYESEFTWMVPAAVATMAVLCAAMSVAVEAPIVSRIVGKANGRIWSTVAVANTASYLVLGTSAWVLVESGVKLEPLQRIFMPLSKSIVGVVFFVAEWLMGGK